MRLLGIVSIVAAAAAFSLPAIAASPALNHSVAPGASGPVDPPGIDEALLLRAAPTLRLEALRAALASWRAWRSAGEIARPLLTVIDYGLPSTAKRLWVFDMEERRLVFHELVAHGRGSGEDLATLFSNVEGSLMSSLGAFVTGATYMGKNGYSMRLRGMDTGVNDLAEARAIVMHGAPYVSEAFARKVGRLGRSWGCPALRPEIARDLIDAIKDSSLLYIWHPSAGAAPAALPTAALPAAAAAAPR